MWKPDSLTCRQPPQVVSPRTPAETNSETRNNIPRESETQIKLDLPHKTKNWEFKTPRNLATRKPGPLSTPAASPPEAHRAMPIPSVPPTSLLEAFRQLHPALLDTRQGRHPGSPANQRCVPDKCATTQSLWVPWPSARLVQSTCEPPPCPDSRWQLPPE